MDQAELQQKIEDISGAIVLVDIADGNGLQQLHGQFRELAVFAAEGGEATVADKARKAGRLVERLVFDAPADGAQLLEQAGLLVSGMQNDLREARAVPVAAASTDGEGRAAPETLSDSSTEDIPIVDDLFEERIDIETDFPADEIAESDLIPATHLDELPAMPVAAEETVTAFGEAPQAVVPGRTPVVSAEPAPVRGGAETPVVPRAILLPENVDMDIFTEFLSRQGGVLEEMEEFVLGLEHSINDNDMNRLRRLVHTMKGEAGLLGLNDVQKVCHATETLLEEGAARRNLVDILLAVKDWLSRSYAAISGNGVEPGPADVLLELLLETEWVAPEEEARGEVVTAAAPVEAAAAEDSVAPEGGVLLNDGDAELLNDFITEATEHLDGVESHMLTIESNPADETSLNAVFRAFHTIKGVAGYLSLEQIGHLSHDVENLLDKARKGDLVLRGRAVDVLFESVDMMKLLVANVRDAMSNGTALAHEPGLAGLVDRVGLVVSGRGEQISDARPVLAQPRMPDTVAVSRPAVESRPPQQEVSETAEDSDGAARSAGDGQFVQVRESIKVDSDRLDKLIDTIGELVITESMVSQMMRDKYSETNMMGNLSQLDKITRQLQEMSTSLRMVPVRATFQKMARLVRDLAKKSGKRIDFIMSGEDTELDKSVVDKIGDPLVHMIRNSVDHGIENADERQRSGKNPVGRVELRAFHKGGSIYIEVVDDGRGLNRERIRAKAIENGMIGENAVLGDKEIYALIFQPGFSTATVVTDVSGRGIGMDVVRRNIDSLRGRIEIQSESGRGSVFSIRLPLTLAIIDGMMVGVGTERYIIPTLTIVRSLRPKKEDFSSVQGRGEMYSLDGTMIPVFYLNRLFALESDVAKVEDGLLVIVENDGLYTGLVVDELFGQHQIVIKTLGRLLQGIPGISGSTIMTDGHVALILDIAGLVKLANRERIATG